MSADDFEFGERHKINFDFNGRELTAHVYLEPKDGADPTGDILDFVLTDEIECEDADTGETVEVTEGVKAAILLALRNEVAELKDPLEGEEDEKGDLNIRIFKPDKR